MVNYSRDLHWNSAKKPPWLNEFSSPNYVVVCMKGNILVLSDAYGRNPKDNSKYIVGGVT